MPSAAARRIRTAEERQMLVNMADTWEALAVDQRCAATAVRPSAPSTAPLSTAVRPAPVRARRAA